RGGRVQRGLLRDVGDAHAAGVDDAAGVGLAGPGDQPQQRRLAAAVGTDDADPVALVDPEGDVGQDLLLGVADADPLEADEVHASAPPPVPAPTGRNPTRSRTCAIVSAATTRALSAPLARAAATAAGSARSSA